MKIDKYEIKITSIDGFVDMSLELAEHIEKWLKETNKIDKINAEAEFMGEENE